MTAQKLASPSEFLPLPFISPTFGAISSTAVNPHVGQLALKVCFLEELRVTRRGIGAGAWREVIKRSECPLSLRRAAESIKGNDPRPPCVR